MNSRSNGVALAAGAAAGILLLLLPAAARAQAAPAPPPIALRVGGACPEEGMVAAALRRLLPQRVVVSGGAGGPSTARLTVEIDDLGRAWRVVMPGRSRTFTDAQRDCSERAHAVAVLVALAAEPPRLPRASSLLGPAWRVDVSASLGGELAPEAIGLATFGVSLRAAVVRDRWGGSVGVTGLVPSQATFEGVGVRVLQVPLHAGLRVGLVRRGRLSLWGDVGGALVLLTAMAPQLTDAHLATGVDVGFRAALDLDVELAPRWRALFTLQGRLMPVPAWFHVTGQGQLGTMPHGWLALSAGLCWGVR